MEGAEPCPRVKDGVGGEVPHPRFGVQKERFLGTSAGTAEEASGRFQVCGQVSTVTWEAR